MEKIILHKEDFGADGQLLRNPDTEKMIVASKKKRISERCRGEVL